MGSDKSHFNVLLWGTKSQDSVHSTDHNFWRERRAEVDSSWGPSVCQPNTLPLGQTSSQILTKCVYPDKTLVVDCALKTIIYHQCKYVTLNIISLVVILYASCNVCPVVCNHTGWLSVKHRVTSCNAPLSRLRLVSPKHVWCAFNPKQLLFRITKQAEKWNKMI